MDQSVNDTTRVITLHVPVCILIREAPVSLSRAEMHTLLVELCKEKEEIIKCHLCTAPILKSHLLQDSHHQLLEPLAILILLAPLHMHHQINYCTRFPVAPADARQVPIMHILSRLHRRVPADQLLSYQHPPLPLHPQEILPPPSWHLQSCSHCGAENCQQQCRWRAPFAIHNLPVQDTEAMTCSSHREQPSTCGSLHVKTRHVAHCSGVRLRLGYLKKRQRAALPENSPQSFVLPAKAHTDKTVPLPEIHWRWWMPRLNAHHTAVHLGWGPEVVAANLNDRTIMAPDTEDTAQQRPKQKQHLTIY